jgi:hypothetical protein
MINGAERIKLIREKLEKTSIIKFKEPIDVSVQRQCLEFRKIKDIHKEGRSIICTEEKSIYNETGEGVLNIREIKPGSVLFILWSILSQKERSEIIEKHFYNDTEWAYLKYALKKWQ